MYQENENIILVSKSNIEELLKTIIKSEFQEMEKRLAKHSKVLTREQAAERLFVCPNTISSYIKSGRLKNRGVGRKVLLFESDLEGIKPGSYTHYSKN